MDIFGLCPVCKADWTGDKIPEGNRSGFGNRTHYTRILGIYSRDKDKIIAWRCPDCETNFDKEFPIKIEIT